MLNRHMLTDESVATLFDMMVWLSAQYGPPVKQTVPKVVNPELPLHERRWAEDDPRTVFAWAEAEAAYLSKASQMENWSVQVAPNGNRANLNPVLKEGLPPIEASGEPTLTPLKSNVWSEDKYPGYFVDYFGRPTFFYDPRRCEEAGYFAKTILPQFALLKIYAKHPPIEFGEDSIEKLMQMTACHMGLGFTLLALSQAGSPQIWTPMAILSPNQPDKDELPYLYGTLITLAAHGLSREQVIASYGKLMTPRTRKFLETAYDHIETQKGELKLLRLLSKPTRSERPEHNRLDPAQASGGLG